MTGTFIIFALFLVVLVGGIIYLQIFLSKKEKKLPGLILPIIILSGSLAYTLFGLGYAAYAGIATVGSAVNDNEMSIIVFVLRIFVRNNIPTVVLLAIHAACRGKRHRQRILGKMSVQDLS